MAAAPVVADPGNPPSLASDGNWLALQAVELFPAIGPQAGDLRVWLGVPPFIAAPRALLYYMAFTDSNAISSSLKLIGKTVESVPVFSVPLFSASGEPLYIPVSTKVLTRGPPPQEPVAYSDQFDSFPYDFFALDTKADGSAIYWPTLYLKALAILAGGYSSIPSNIDTLAQTLLNKKTVRLDMSAPEPLTGLLQYNSPENQILIHTKAEKLCPFEPGPLGMSCIVSDAYSYAYALDANVISVAGFQLDKLDNHNTTDSTWSIDLQRLPSIVDFAYILMPR